MKQFFSIFFAIVAGAVAVGGFLSIKARVERDRERALQLVTLRSMLSGSGTSEYSAVVDGTVKEVTFLTAQRHADGFLNILRSGRVNRADTRLLQIAFVDNYREVVKVVRAKYPERRAWADELEPRLNDIENFGQGK